MRYRKKPIEIEARELSLEDFEAVKSWCGGSELYLLSTKVIRGLSILTLEGAMSAEIGDWIIKGIKGEFYPCKPDIFEATYEAVDDSPTPAKDGEG